ncbi:hypothetical protein [Vreelandella titanicae]|uniref:hypothetical protein n=1 Tax=Vreelandella titanicae TaxID=664683 RepID=UPI003FD8C226
MKFIDKKWNDCLKGICPVCDRSTNEIIHTAEGQALRYCSNCKGAWGLCESKGMFHILKPVISIFDPCNLCGEPNQQPINGHYFITAPTNSH